MAPINWLAFWDTPHSIYVNARHRDIHYRLIAEQIAALVPSPQARMLDYGCGEALHADLVAAASPNFCCAKAHRACAPASPRVLPIIRKSARSLRTT